jgi:putative pyruvate formate lyase activating enzyme
MEFDTANLISCTVCPHECSVDRVNKKGFCNSFFDIRISNHQLHFWEEPVLSGNHGSGTIFFSNCTMRCVYCQNYAISQDGIGRVVTIEQLVDCMFELEALNAHNINLVTPSHFSLQLVQAITIAKKSGLHLPIIWNSSSYEKPETLKKLDGLVNIYLPDFRYYNDDMAFRYSGIKHYTKWAKSSIIEMYRQTGHMKVESDIAKKGILIRLLVMPGQVEQIKDILYWTADNLGTETWISLMGQYYPTNKSAIYPEINRSINADEYSICMDYMNELGFENGYRQEIGSSSDYTPDFK